jgi:hypothetical protein
LKVRASVNAFQLKSFLLKKASPKFKEIKLNPNSYKIEDICLYFRCSEGKRWLLKDSQSILELIDLNMWSLKVISPDQTSTSKPATQINEL